MSKVKQTEDLQNHSSDCSRNRILWLAWHDECLDCGAILQ